MICEIRDVETANIAINALLTVHLVFSTLHTNDAPGAVARLVDIGVNRSWVPRQSRPGP
jgi:general secretion pathway protein E/type IV pilus assembly protein PilB